MMRILHPHRDLFKRIVLVLATSFLLMGTLMAQQFVANGTAANISPAGAVDNNYRLTQDLGSQNGNIWYHKKIDLRYPVKISFSINLGNKFRYAGADGMAFVLQQDTKGTAAKGGGGGGNWIRK